jgi:hypothetical protein
VDAQSRQLCRHLVPLVGGGRLRHHHLHSMCT